jgi:hypothetical protein
LGRSGVAGSRSNGLKTVCSNMKMPTAPTMAMTATFQRLITAHFVGLAAATAPQPFAPERALFTRRRKEACEALHPETKHETFKGNQHTGSRQVGDNHTERFTADTAKKTGQSERAIQRDASRGERVAPEVLTQIAGTKLDTGKTLDELASVPKEAQCQPALRACGVRLNTRADVALRIAPRRPPRSPARQSNHTPRRHRRR